MYYVRHAAMIRHRAKFKTFQSFQIPAKLSEIDQQKNNSPILPHWEGENVPAILTQRRAISENVASEGNRGRPVNLCWCTTERKGLLVRDISSWVSIEFLDQLANTLNIMSQIVAPNFCVCSFLGFRENCLYVFRRRKKIENNRK